MSEAGSHFEYSGVENLEAMKHARRYNAYLLALIKHYVSGHALLDFGAGAGTFALPLSAAGFDVSCLEPDQALASELAARGLTVVSEPAQLQPATLDSVYSLNVLEHIEDDTGAIAALHGLLKPGGRLVLYVPAFELLFSAMDRRVGHYRRYRRTDLGEKLRAGGFNVLHARYVDSLGFLSALVYRWLGDDSGVISPGPVRIYDRFVFPASLVLDRILQGSFGKNLLVVATRK